MNATRGASASSTLDGNALRVFAPYKADAFGSVSPGELCEAEGIRAVIVRDFAAAHPLLRLAARYLAHREARALRHLGGAMRVPLWIGKTKSCSVRSALEGDTFAALAPKDPAVYRRARQLLFAMHRRGITHNDTHKPQNWIVDERGEPGLLDFQLAWRHRRRGGFARLCAWEDHRHLVKHKRRYAPESLTAVDHRFLAKKSWIARAWMRRVKPLYQFVTRRLLRQRDNEGRGFDSACGPR